MAAGVDMNTHAKKEEGKKKKREREKEGRLLKGKLINR